MPVDLTTARETIKPPRRLTDNADVTLCAGPLPLRAMDAPPDRAGRGASFALLVALCLFSALLGRLAYVIRPYDSDGAMFIYMGKLVAEGGRFCHDLVDNKFPTAGLITSAAWRAFGDRWGAYVALQTLIGLGGALLLARAAARNIGDYAKWPAGLFALCYLNFNVVVFGGFQLETLQALFAIVAAGAALEALNQDDLRDSFVVGLAAGCAAMVKPSGLGVAGAFALAMTLRLSWRPRRLLTRGLLGASGLAIPVTASLAYLIGTETLGDMPALWRQISRYAASSAWDDSDWTKPLTVLLIGGFPLLVRGWIFRRPDNRVAVRIDRVILLFLASWLLVEIAGVAMQRRMYAYHFMVLVPPLALLFGLIPRRDHSGPLAGALVPIAIFSIAHAALTVELSYTGTSRLDVSNHLQARTTPGERVWRDDLARLLIETDLRAGSRHPLTFLFANWDSAPLEYGQTILDDWSANRPSYIVMPSDLERWLDHQCGRILELERFPARAANYRLAWRRMDGYVRQHYRLDARFGHETVWERASGVTAR